MVIPDLVTDKEVSGDSVDSDKWCSRIDGALTKVNYLESIRKAGFQNPEILEENCISKKIKKKEKITVAIEKSVAL